MPFAEEFINAFIAGQQARESKFDLQRKQQRALFEDEDREIEKEMLQHRLKEMKIQQRLQARQAAAQNLEALSGIPERDITPDMTEGGVLPAHSLIDTGGEQDSIQTLLKQIEIPGIEELGIPSIKRRPMTEESQLARALAEARIKADTTLHNVSRGGSLVTGTGRTVATGPPVVQRPVDVFSRDANGVETHELLSPEDATGRTFTRAPLPRRPTGGGGAQSVSNEQMENYVTGIISGNLPAQVPNSALGVKIQAELSKRGFNLAKANQDLRAMRAHYTALNGAGLAEARIAADIADSAITELEDAQAAWQSSGRGVFSQAALTAARNGLMGPEAKLQAQDFESAIKEVQQAVAILKSGGSQANNKVLEQIEAELTTGSNIPATIKRLRTGLQYRIAAVRNLEAITPSSLAGPPVGGGAPAPAAAPVPAAAGGVPPEVSAALKSEGPGRYTLSDGSIWIKDGSGRITAGK